MCPSVRFWLSSLLLAELGLSLGLYTPQTAQAQSEFGVEIRADSSFFDEEIKRSYGSFKADNAYGFGAAIAHFAMPLTLGWELDLTPAAYYQYLMTDSNSRLATIFGDMEASNKDSAFRLNAVGLGAAIRRPLGALNPPAFWSCFPGLWAGVELRYLLRSMNLGLEDPGFGGGGFPLRTIETSKPDTQFSPRINAGFDAAIARRLLLALGATVVAYYRQPDDPLRDNARFESSYLNARLGYDLTQPGGAGIAPYLLAEYHFTSEALVQKKYFDTPASLLRAGAGVRLGWDSWHFALEGGKEDAHGEAVNDGFFVGLVAGYCHVPDTPTPAPTMTPTPTQTPTPTPTPTFTPIPAVLSCTGNRTATLDSGDFPAWEGQVSLSPHKPAATLRITTTTAVTVHWEQPDTQTGTVTAMREDLSPNGETTTIVFPEDDKFRTLTFTYTRQESMPAGSITLSLECEDYPPPVVQTVMVETSPTPCPRVTLPEMCIFNCEKDVISTEVITACADVAKTIHPVRVISALSSYGVHGWQPSIAGDINGIETLFQTLSLHLVDRINETSPELILGISQIQLYDSRLLIDGGALLKEPDTVTTLVEIINQFTKSTKYDRQTATLFKAHLPLRVEVQPQGKTRSSRGEPIPME